MPMEIGHVEAIFRYPVKSMVDHRLYPHLLSLRELRHPLAPLGVVMLGRTNFSDSRKQDGAPCSRVRRADGCSGRAR